MHRLERWMLTQKEKNRLVSALTSELAVLRAKAGASQEDMAAILGVSRQTYGAIERKKRRMTWCTYLSLILFFEFAPETHDMLRGLDAFPRDALLQKNDGTESATLDKIMDGDLGPVLETLDDQAWHTIRTLVMIEYARCAKLPGESVVRAFDGIAFANAAEKKASSTKANGKKSAKQ